MKRGERRRRLAAFAAGALLCLPAGATRAQSTRLLPIRPAVSTDYRQLPRRPDLGERPGMRLSRPVGLRSRPDLQRAGWLQGPALPDTLAVLVLRVSFQPDTDPRTTGDGTFDLRDLDTFVAEEGHEIDTAPHDRGYTERHLLALHNYWWANSDGALSITADVFPAQAEGSYVLPREMAYYGFETPLEDLIAAFEALVADAVSLAEAGSDPIDWHAYDAFVIHHAGADWQGDVVGAGDTPGDLPSAYVALGEPVMVQGRAVADATVIPETVSQDGFVGGVNGVFAHEFGHQLGLPDLYDTATGNTAVGLYALMDLGDFTGGVIDDLFVQGVLPAAISPWSRIYMGWATPVEIWPGSARTVDLAASTLPLILPVPPPTTNKVAMVRAAEQQAFLVEYRSDDLDGEPGVSLFWNDGVIDGTGALIGGIKTRTYEYDALLPGSGILIWHLDQAVAAADPDGNGLTNLEENTLQTDRLRRFLDLEEADGLQELGWTPGYLGAAGDYWQPSPTVPFRFGNLTEPNSASSSGAPTGIEIRTLAAASALLRRIEVEASGPRWSAHVPAPDPVLSVPWLITPHDISVPPVVAVLDGSGGLHLWEVDGRPRAGVNPVWTAASEVVVPVVRAGDALAVCTADSAHFLAFDGQFLGSSATGGIPSVRPIGYERAGTPCILLALQDGGLVEVEPAGITASGSLGGAARTLARAREDLFLAGQDDRLVAITVADDGLITTGELWLTSGNIREVVTFSSMLVDVPTWGIAALDTDGRLYMWRTIQELQGAWPALPGPAERAMLNARFSAQLPQPTGRLAVARFAVGRTAVVIPTVEGLRAFETNGPPLSGWPPPDRGRAAVDLPGVSGTVLTTDRGALIGATVDGEMVAYDGEARFLTGGHLQLSRTPVSDPTLGDGGALGPLLLSVASDSLRAVSLSLWDPPYPAVLWAGPGGGPEGRGAAEFDLGGIAGPQQRPVDRFYVYPNPAERNCTIRVEGLFRDFRVYAYTASGTALGEVARLSSTQAGVYESPLDVGRLAPGVYLLIGVAEAADGTRSRVQTPLVVVR